MFIDLKSQTAVFIVLYQLAEVRTGGGVGGQALFEFGIIGVDFSSAIVFVKVQFGYLSFLLGYLFHETSLSWVQFLGSRARKLGLKSDSETVNDVLVVPSPSVGCKAEF